MKESKRHFTPGLTPPEMLELGVFCGHYSDPEWLDEFPASWRSKAKLSNPPDPACNLFGVDASLPLEHWEAKGWIHPQDPLGWFQWYCRFTCGRRTHDDDRQIRRWHAMRRHEAQIRKNCISNDLGCRPRQRQALLQWAYDSRRM
jgi:hypothetical protein